MSNARILVAPILLSLGLFGCSLAVKSKLDEKKQSGTDSGQVDGQLQPDGGSEPDLLPPPGAPGCFPPFRVNHDLVIVPGGRNLWDIVTDGVGAHVVFVAQDSNDPDSPSRIRIAPLPPLDGGAPHALQIETITGAREGLTALVLPNILAVAASWHDGLQIGALDDRGQARHLWAAGPEGWNSRLLPIDNAGAVQSFYEIDVAFASGRLFGVVSSNEGQGVFSSAPQMGLQNSDVCPFIAAAGGSYPRITAFGDELVVAMRWNALLSAQYGGYSVLTVGAQELMPCNAVDILNLLQVNSVEAFPANDFMAGAGPVIVAATDMGIAFIRDLAIRNPPEVGYELVNQNTNQIVNDVQPEILGGAVDADSQANLFYAKLLPNGHEIHWRGNFGTGQQDAALPNLGPAFGPLEAAVDSAGNVHLLYIDGATDGPPSLMYTRCDPRFTPGNQPPP
jgi:hypothetical protein